MARTLNHTTHGTVQGWWERDVIPAHRQAAVLEAAQDAGVKIALAELIPGFVEEADDEGRAAA